MVDNSFVDGSDRVFQVVLKSRDGTPLLHDLRVPAGAPGPGRLLITPAWAESRLPDGGFRAFPQKPSILCRLGPVPGRSAASVCRLPRKTTSPGLPLEVVADIPLPGGATRMDYITVNPASHRVYLAHMGDGAVIAVDTARRRVLRVVGGMPLVRGVLDVPELGRVYAAAAGSGEVVVLESDSLDVIARIKAGDVDGLDYAPAVHRLFVTDQHGGNDVVIDARTDRVIKKIAVGGDVGNTRFDPATGRVLVAVGAGDELVAISAESLDVVGRYPLPGVRGAHGIALDPSTRTAFVAGEDNATVCAFSLRDDEVTAVARVGKDVDVLDVDPVLHRLFVASESGVVSVFDVTGGGLRKLAEGFFAPDAHVVGVDPATHLLYFPLRNIDGRPVLRVARYMGQ